MMNNRIRLWLVLVLVVSSTLAGVACGDASSDDPNGSRTDFDSAIEDDRKLASLNLEDKRNICADSVKYLVRWSQNHLRDTCTTIAHTDLPVLASDLENDEDAKKQCSKRFDQCKRQFQNEYPYNARVLCKDRFSDTREVQCDKTVADLEACAEGFAGRVFDGLSNPRRYCPDVTVDFYENYQDVTHPEYESEYPKSCRTLAEACPNFPIFEVIGWMTQIIT